MDQNKNNHLKTKVITKQENTCLKHNHQLRGKNHRTNKTTTCKELIPTKKHKALNRRDQSSKTLTPHTYTKGSKGRRKASNIREGEWKPELMFETRINLPSQQNIHEGKHYPNLE
ncbi:hypothetical protein DY000_02053495 [Brassica cretica]|uniref:Uncharacterized protein n=1 Tax=Brassica cretica TaxID=69181 RepID=A0ABQ7A8N7_BRACR|nr:hypothetical protein DY000_02053495 [Brassica cretica]